MYVSGKQATSCLSVAALSHLWVSNMGGSEGGGVEEHFLLSIDHVQQRHNWDCGLACVMMILPPQARDLFSAKLYQICEEEGFDRSTWSIDLAYLLQRFGIKHRYVTVTIGVDPGFSSESFYNHVLCKDAQRVLDRFREASSQGVVVEQGCVTLSNILTHLYHSGPVILLTNAHLLICERCAKVMPQLRSCLPCSPPYQGHYILLIGYSMKKSLVYYRNPSFKNHICSIAFSRLDKARKSYGTDEDVLFIYNHTKPQGP
ncbi:protein GUCD1-like isoform X1 [Macrobrachium nipponense]|uniref:protein GUCD1-like isoform X1 n=2 Tax=Macrobrachium nipponense TaxID=159736 RepID=UPI0030C7D1E4